LYDTGFDHETASKIRALELQKTTAVQNEDFEQAKYLRDEIDQLKKAGSELANLERLKQ
jgi:protein-arginine kinase activator protein McsA